MIKISPKYQVVIPKDIRESMNLKPGMKMEMVKFGDAIYLVQLKNMKSMRGALKLKNTDPERDKKDRKI